LRWCFLHFLHSTQSALYPAFLSVQANLSSIVNVADDREAFSYECSTSAVKRRSQDRHGLLVATNHFVDNSWGIAPPDNDAQNAWTVKRRNNLLALAERYKGSFDVERMKHVLDTKIADGGATQPTETIYQIVAVPKERVMWLKAPGNFEWQKIDLNRFF